MKSKLVIKFYGHYSEPDNSCHYLLLEFCNSDLSKVIKLRKTLAEKQAWKIIDQIILSQHDLSKEDILHRDLKPLNIGIHFINMTSQVRFDKESEN